MEGEGVLMDQGDDGGRPYSSTFGSQKLWGLVRGQLGFQATGRSFRVVGGGDGGGDGDRLYAGREDLLDIVLGDAGDGDGGEGDLSGGLAGEVEAREEVAGL